MAKIRLETGSTIDGFLIGRLLHKGGMAALWEVTRSDLAFPALMKIPIMSEGEASSNIVSFEMEQMIAAKLSGPHVPRFVAAGDFAVQPYIVIEQIPGKTLQARFSEFPLSYDEAADIGARIAIAMDDLHRQHVIHLDIKPANLMFRPTGEVVLLDFGLSRHDHLPDLMFEEFHVPFGTAPYMAPEQLLGVRHDCRSDIFALGALLYQISTGELPFGDTETKGGMRQRLWRDPVPPRKLRADYPPWLQEIVLRCLEIKPAWRYPSAGQLAFDLRAPDKVKLTARAERIKRDSWSTVIRRRFNSDLTSEIAKPIVSRQISSAPIIAIAVDLQEASEELSEALLTAARRLLATIPAARLACINVLKTNLITIDTTLDEQGNNKHLERMVRLKHWAEPLKMSEERLTIHVLEALDPAHAIVEFAETNRVDHVLIGARQSSLKRSILGSVSAKVAAEATCSVTVVRPPRLATAAADDMVNKEAARA